jgi:uncharacterized membrane protein
MSENSKRSNPRNILAGADVDKRKAKMEAVFGTQRKNRPPRYALAAIALLIGVCAVYAWMQLKPEEPAAAAPLASNPTGSQITLSVNQFGDGKARYYEYRAGDSTIRYFIIRSSDGVLRAAFDACDVCWRAGKGYVQAEDVMVCKNCGQQFASVLVNEVKGGCNPAPLERSIQDDRLIIEVKDILEGKKYFDIPGKV